MHSLNSFLVMEEEKREEPYNAVGALKAQTINDIVYGQITLPPICWFMIGTPAVQRLKNIWQLGPNYAVFPGAIHTRFEHVLGTAYLCDL